MFLLMLKMVIIMGITRIDILYLVIINHIDRILLLNMIPQQQCLQLGVLTLVLQN